MRIWLLQTWEPNELDDSRSRPMRTGLLAQRLLRAGHEVTWWASQYSHKTRAMRRPEAIQVQLPSGVTMRLMRALGYSRNVSLQRLRDHRTVAEDFLRQAAVLPPPDCVVLSYPPIESALAVAEYCQSHRVPWLVDVRDQYPDLYWLNLPSWQQPLGRGISAAMGFQRQAARVFQSASGITANGAGALDWALGYAGRVQRPLDEVIPMSFEPVACDPAELQSARETWLAAHPEWANYPLLVYAGALGQTLDMARLQALCEAVEGKALQVAICGSGDREPELRQWVAKLRNTEYLGNLDAIRLGALQGIAAWGLVPYRASANFEGGIPNKPVENLAQGLPIISTIKKGDFAALAKGAGVQVDWGEDPGAVLAAVLDPTHPHETRKMAARQLFEENFHPDRHYGRWIELIEACAAGGT